MAAAAVPFAGGWSPAAGARLMRRRSPLMIRRARGRQHARTAEYRPGADGSRRGAATARHASTTRSAIRSAEKSSARARPSTRGSGASRCGASAVRQRSRSHGAHSAPSIPPRTTGWIPTGVPKAGTPHASASITESPKPSSCDGTSTALAALIQYGTSSGATRPITSSGTSPASSRARSARLSGRDGSCGKSRYGPAGSSPSRARASARGIGRKRSSATPTGSTAIRRRAPAPGRLAANARDTVAPSAVSGSAARLARFDRRTKRSLPCRVTTTGPRRAASAGHADSPKWACTTSKRCPRVRRCAVAIARSSARGPGGNASTWTSTSPRRRSAATWSATNTPRCGASGAGQRLVTTSARTAPNLDGRPRRSGRNVTNSPHIRNHPA